MDMINEDLITEGEDIVGGELLPEARPIINEVLNQKDTQEISVDSKDSSIDRYFPVVETKPIIKIETVTENIISVEKMKDSNTNEIKIEDLNIKTVENKEESKI